MPVKFCPKTKGTFNQHWEVEYQPLMAGKVAAQDKVTTKVSLTAEVTLLAFQPSSTGGDGGHSYHQVWRAQHFYHQVWRALLPLSGGGTFTVKCGGHFYR